MADVVLAGDIGGTKTNLALYAVERPGRPALVRESSFPSRQYPSGLETVIGEFLRGETLVAAAFGIAGPVVDETVHTTNLPWTVAAASLRTHLGTPRVRLLNDLEATANGALYLPPEKLTTLNPGAPHLGNRAVIAAGTGLGQAILFWNGQRHVPVATEGGHADFAPRNEREIALLRFAETLFAGHLSYERVLSGPGLHVVFRFLTEALGRPIGPAVQARLAGGEDPSAVVGEVGVAGGCATCVEAVEMFLDLYGAQAGNLALTGMTVGGLYIGGGIVTKMLPKVTDGRLLAAFFAKGRYEPLMRTIPVWVILDPKTALLGAAQAAVDLLD
jgi:glucokinase